MSYMQPSERALSLRVGAARLVGAVPPASCRGALLLTPLAIRTSSLIDFLALLTFGSWVARVASHFN